MAQQDAPRLGGFPCAWWIDYRDSIGYDAIAFLAYLWTNDRRRIEGIYRLPIGYITEDLGIEDKRVREYLKSLEEHDLIEYDYKAGVVFLRHYMESQYKLRANTIADATAKGIYRGIAQLAPRVSNGILASWQAERDELAPLVAALEELELAEWE